MKRALGKKAHIQDGTMTAFATCDCIAVCQANAICTCTGDTAQATERTTSMAKIVSTALSGSNYLWG